MSFIFNYLLNYTREVNILHALLSEFPQFDTLVKPAPKSRNWYEVFIYFSIVYSFIQQLFFEWLLCVNHCSRY